MAPALAMAPTGTATNEGLRASEQYVDGSLYVRQLQKKPKTYTTSPHQENIALGARIALTEGIKGKEWECLYELGMRESGWYHLAKNPSSGAFGIPQSLPASKLDSYGDRNDPEVQIRWMLDYIENRYGTPCRALAWSYSHNWY